LSLFELDGHFPVFFNPDAIAQWTGFMGSLASDPVATIPARPRPDNDPYRRGTIVVSTMPTRPPSRNWRRRDGVASE